MGRVKGNQQVQYPWAVRAEKFLPPQAVGNIPRQVVRSYVADTGTWKELCVAKKRHSNCLGPVLGWCLPLAEPDGLEARARGPVIYSLQVSLPGHRGGLESPSGGTTRPPSAILFSFTVSILANYSKPSFNKHVPHTQRGSQKFIKTKKDRK